jgi:hypothetical protein
MTWTEELMLSFGWLATCVLLGAVVARIIEYL